LRDDSPQAKGFLDFGKAYGHSRGHVALGRRSDFEVKLVIGRGRKVCPQIHGFATRAGGKTDHAKPSGKTWGKTPGSPETILQAGVIVVYGLELV